MEFTKQDTKTIKGIAILLMLCHHLFAFPERLNGVSYVSLPFIGGSSVAMFIAIFGKLCISLFTLLGGYGAYISLSRTKSRTELVGRHIFRLYSSYWKVFAIAVPVSLLLGLPHGTLFLTDLIYSFLGLRFTYCDEWWFVTPFAILTVFSPLIADFADRRNASFQSSLLWIICANAAIYYIIPPLMRTPALAEFSETVFWTEVYTAITLLPAYALGAVLAKHNVLSAIKAYCRAGRALCIPAALIALCALLYIHPFNWLAYDFINAAVFIMCMLALLESRIGAFVTPVLIKLGEESTCMWLVHTLLCYKWCQKLVYAPKYAVLIFLWLVALSYGFARLIRLLYSALGKLCSAVFKKA